MEQQYSIYALCAIVISLYALRDGHTRYLPDLLGLALALAAPRQAMAIVAVVLFAAIRHTALAYGLADLLPEWLLPIALPAACNMSISEQEVIEAETAYKQRISDTDPSIGKTEILQPVAEKTAENVFSDKLTLLAAMVISGTLGRTDAARYLGGAQSGRRYQIAARQLREEIERQQNHYPALDANKQQKVSKP